MDPLTHVFASVALSRAGLDRTTRLATPILLVAGLLPDVDVISVAGGAPLYLIAHRTATHSLLGAAIQALLIAAIFSWWARNQPDLRRTEPSDEPASVEGPPSFHFRGAFLVAGVGLAAHLLLDLGNDYGVKLLWPFSAKWYAWDLWPGLDSWILAVLAAGLFLPALFRLIGQEIGAQSKRSPRGTLAALVLLAFYCGGRAVLHARAVNVLDSRLYHGQEPQATAAFPSPISPLHWRGVVETATAIEVPEISFVPGTYFDPDRGRAYYKPEASPALDAARAASVAREFLGFARFPLAHVATTGASYRVEFRDLRYYAEANGWTNPIATVELDARLRVIKEELRFGSAHRE